MDRQVDRKLQWQWRWASKRCRAHRKEHSYRKQEQIIEKDINGEEMENWFLSLQSLSVRLPLKHIPVFLCDVASVVKSQHIQDRHGNDTVGGKQKNTIHHHHVTTVHRWNWFFVYPPLPPQTHFAQSNLKAMTMTRARMVPCMNFWLMQPWSGSEFCNQHTDYIKIMNPVVHFCSLKTSLSPQTLLPGLTVFFLSGPLPVLLK